MRLPKNMIEIGIVGCGAIGSRMAKTIRDDFRQYCRLSALHDINQERVEKLIDELNLKRNISTDSLEELIDQCDFVIEAVNTDATVQIVKQSLNAKKNVLVMSVGRLLDKPNLFKLARKNKRYLLLPSGAIAGVDSVKAASQVKTKSITLTTRKPPAGFADNAYLRQQGIDLKSLTKETVIFEGPVNQAVKHFPQNINVAATLALASQHPDKLIVKIIASPEYKTNSHEIEMIGDFGRFTTKTENTVCPDNPKTSYLAVLSGLQTLKQFCSGVLIGT